MATVTVVGRRGQRPAGCNGHGLEAIGLSRGDTLVEATGTRIRTTGKAARSAPMRCPAPSTWRRPISSPAGKVPPASGVEGVNDQRDYVSTANIQGGTVQTQGALAHGLGALSGGKLEARDLAVTTERSGRRRLRHARRRSALTGGAVTTEGAEAYGLLAIGEKPARPIPPR